RGAARRRPSRSPRGVLVDRSDVLRLDRDGERHDGTRERGDERQRHVEAHARRHLAARLEARRGRARDRQALAAGREPLVVERERHGRGREPGALLGRAGGDERARRLPGRALDGERPGLDATDGEHQVQDRHEQDERDPEELDDGAPPLRPVRASDEPCEHPHDGAVRPACHGASSSACPSTVSTPVGPSSPTTGSGAETVTSTTGRPSTTLWRTETSSAYRGDSAAPISARVRAAPSCGPRSARPATRAPSAAQSTRVARTCTASATWTTPRNSTSTRTATRVK